MSKFKAKTAPGLLKKEPPSTKHQAPSTHLTLDKTKTGTAQAQGKGGEASFGGDRSSDRTALHCVATTTTTTTDPRLDARIVSHRIIPKKRKVLLSISYTCTTSQQIDDRTLETSAPSHPPLSPPPKSQGYIETLHDSLGIPSVHVFASVDRGGHSGSNPRPGLSSGRAAGRGAR